MRQSAQKKIALAIRPPPLTEATCSYWQEPEHMAGPRSSALFVAAASSLARTDEFATRLLWSRRRSLWPPSNAMIWLTLRQPILFVRPLRKMLPFNQKTDTRMAIPVSHRFSTAQAPDRMIATHDGKILEQGNHESMHAENGQYASLFRLQARGSIDHCRTELPEIEPR